MIERKYFPETCKATMAEGGGFREAKNWATNSLHPPEFQGGAHRQQRERSAERPALPLHQQALGAGASPNRFAEKP